MPEGDNVIPFEPERRKRLRHIVTEWKRVLDARYGGLLEHQRRAAGHDAESINAELNRIGVLLDGANRLLDNPHAPSTELDSWLMEVKEYRKTEPLTIKEYKQGPYRPSHSGRQ